MRGGRAHSLSLSSPLSNSLHNNSGEDNDGGINEEAMKALRSWVKESLVDSKERNERGGYYELLDAFSSINNSSGDINEAAKKIDESLVALVDALAEHATYVDYRAHEHLLECVTLEKCSMVSLRTVDDAYLSLIHI